MSVSTMIVMKKDIWFFFGIERIIIIIIKLSVNMVIPFFIEMPVLKNLDNRYVYLVIEIIATKMFYH